MGFEKVTDKFAKQIDEPPELTIFQTGEQLNGYLNQAAVKKWFEAQRHVEYLADVEYSRLGIDHTAGEGQHSYTLGNKESGGASLALTTVLAPFDISPGDLEERYYVSLEYDEEHGFVVADLQKVVEGATGAVHCPKCGKRCANESGMKSHVGSTHDSARQILEDANPDEVGEAAPEGDDSWQEYSNRGESA